MGGPDGTEKVWAPTLGPFSATFRPEESFSDVGGRVGRLRLARDPDAPPPPQLEPAPNACLLSPCRCPGPQGRRSEMQSEAQGGGPPSRAV